MFAFSRVRESSGIRNGWNILSNNRNLTVVNLSVDLEHQQFYKPEVHLKTFETDKLFFSFNSGEKLGHLNDRKRLILVLNNRRPFSKNKEN